jgi:hypothetical protein
MNWGAFFSLSFTAFFCMIENSTLKSGSEMDALVDEAITDS